MRCYRLVDETYRSTAFSGEGARRYGGRWNSPGLAMIYTARTLSLAQLELLVHLDARDVLLGHWRYFTVDVYNDAVLALDTWNEIPADFGAWPAPASTRAIGDRWITESASVALSVPSVVTPGEYNLLLNPAHPDYHAVVAIGGPRTLTLDSRLVKTPDRAAEQGNRPSLEGGNPVSEYRFLSAARHRCGDGDLRGVGDR